jgi:hypothetical protein
MNLVTPLGLVVALLAAPAAAQHATPDWPCVQRKVEHLSLAAIWPNPVPEDAAPLPDALDDLAERMALRRVSVEEVGALVDDLAAESPGIDADTYGRLFAAAFERMDRQRSRLVAGIARYARGQTDLAHEIDVLRGEFAELEAAEEPDFDRLDELEAEIDWRERVFDDRRAALTYVCESPVLLEKRAYEIAQLLLAKVD